MGQLRSIRDRCMQVQICKMGVGNRAKKKTEWERCREARAPEIYMAARGTVADRGPHNYIIHKLMNMCGWVAEQFMCGHLMKVHGKKGKGE